VAAHGVGSGIHLRFDLRADEWPADDAALALSVARVRGVGARERAGKGVAWAAHNIDS